jgi:hypothetical protein
MIKDMKLKFKQGVYGIIFECDFGDVTEVNNPITEDLKHFFSRNTKMSLFDDVDTIVECFGIDEEKLESDIWSEIFDVIE